MLLVTVLTVVLTVRLYSAVPKGFMPLQDTGILAGSTQASPDISFTAMEDRQRQVVDVLLADPAVATVSSWIGVGSGWSSMNRGWMTITLKPLAERKISSEAVIARLRGPLLKVAGVQTFLFSAQDLRGGGRQGGSQYQFAMISPNLAELRYWAQALEDRLQATPGIVDVSSDQDHAGPQVNVAIDRDAAARLGVNVTDIDNALNNAYAQRQILNIYTSRNQYKVVLETDPKLQVDPSLLGRIYVGDAGGGQDPAVRGGAFRAWHRAAVGAPPGPVPRCDPELQPAGRHGAGRCGKAGGARRCSICGCRTMCTPSSPATRSGCRSRWRPSRC